MNWIAVLAVAVVLIALFVCFSKKKGGGCCGMKHEGDSGPKSS